VGILGGSFDPPHEGHLKVAEAALESLRLDRLLVIPVGSAPHKQGGGMIDGAIRLRLCEAAFAGLPRVEVSSIELDRDGPSWTVDTLRELGSRMPDGEFFLILGEDMAHDLPDWRDPREVVRLARVAWAPRPPLGAGSGHGPGIESVVTGLGGEMPLELAMEPVDLSSTTVRKRLDAGLPIDGLVPRAVLDLIESEGLYPTPAGEADQ